MSKKAGFKFKSDHSIIWAGFELFVDCAIISQYIYKLIIENNCRMVYCNSDYRRIQNIIIYIFLFLELCQKYCQQGLMLLQTPDLGNE